MVSGAVHTFIPEETENIEELEEMLKSYVAENLNDENIPPEEAIEQCIEVREDCVGLNHTDVIDVDAVFSTVCVEEADMIDGVVRVGAENKFGSMNAVMFEIDSPGEVNISKRIGHEINPDEVPRIYEFKGIEAINPDLTEEP